MEKITIKNLSFSYSGRAAKALDDINITVYSGEFICLCGKSGCGKSTLLRHLKPQLAPHGNLDGSIYFEGQDIRSCSKQKLAQSIGFVFQNSDDSIVCDKVWHELAFGLESLGLPKEEIRARVAEMASFFGIQNWYRKDVNTLSGGQKQMLSLASAMVCSPSVLVLDEPTSQLDPISARDFLDALTKINDELGTTIILCEHRLEEVIPISDRVIVMDKGKIISDGDAQSVADILNEQKNDMMLAFPTAMRVFYSLQKGGTAPVSIREGRQWLHTCKIDREKVFNDGKSYALDESPLSVKNLWLRYEKNAPDVLKDVSLNLRKGEFYAIVGGNGTGKSTLLGAIMGIKRPWQGKVHIGDGVRIAELVQEPKALFTEKTVLSQLRKTLEESTDANIEDRIQNVLRLCELCELGDHHPYDLSGGEQQRLALAMMLLQNPDVLLLDEPTKGLDAHFKIKLASILKSLQKSGKTILMVSHDIEFCARYADRLAMFFDGSVVSEDKPRAFFAGKSFYTTSANKMARDYLPDAIADSDIIAAIGGSYAQYTAPDDECNVFQDIKKSEQVTEPKEKKTKIRLGWQTILAYSLPLLLIPLTIYIGMAYFDDRKYYLISMLILLETILPLFIAFESRRPHVRELVMISVFCAIAVCSRIAFAFVPQFKPVTALMVLAGLCFGAEKGFLIGAITAFVSNMYFSQGPWTPWQMFVFGLIGFLSGLIFYARQKRPSKLVVTLFGFAATIVVYGGIMNPASVIMYQDNITLSMIYTSYTLGFPLDFMHAVSTAFFLWFGYDIIYSKIKRIKTKYNM